MRVATVDGLVTLYYDGSRELYNREQHIEWVRARRFKRPRQNRSHVDEDTQDIESLDVSDECKSYKRERLSWQQIIVVEGVTEIPGNTFFQCFNIKRVIFSNSVIRIRRCAFYHCKNLVFIKLSLSLEYIGNWAFKNCNLCSVFIPPLCREICNCAFEDNKNLSILNIPQDVELGNQIISATALAKVSPINGPTNNSYNHTVNDNVNQWLKNINNDENLALHRACASFNPLKEVIHTIIQEKGLKAFRVENSAGITPSRYLKENPYTELSEKEIIHDYLMKIMGEVE